MHDGVRELFEHEGFKGCFGAEIEGAGLSHVRDDRCTGSAERQHLMTAAGSSPNSRATTSIGRPAS